MIGANGFAAATNDPDNLIVHIVKKSADEEGDIVLEDVDGNKWMQSTGNPHLLAEYRSRGESADAEEQPGQAEVEAPAADETPAAERPLEAA